MIYQSGPHVRRSQPSIYIRDDGARNPALLALLLALGYLNSSYWMIKDTDYKRLFTVVLTGAGNGT